MWKHFTRKFQKQNKINFNSNNVLLYKKRSQTLIDAFPAINLHKKAVFGRLLKTKPD